jgi:hypothetical protein
MEWPPPPSAGHLQNKGIHVVKREPRGQWDAIWPNISPVVGQDTTCGTYRRVSLNAQLNPASCHGRVVRQHC